MLDSAIIRYLTCVIVPVYSMYLNAEIGTGYVYTFIIDTIHYLCTRYREYRQNNL